MSLYAEYLKEKSDDKILELDFGFATYRHLPEEKSTYIIDIYIRPVFRKDGLASQMADQIVGEARAAGHTKLIGSVVPTSKGSTDSLKVLIAYGMHLKSCSNNFIIFEKDII